MLPYDVHSFILYRLENSDFSFNTVIFMGGLNLFTSNNSVNFRTLHLHVKKLESLEGDKPPECLNLT